MFIFCFKDDNTWFDSNLKLNRRNILESIEQKTVAQYEQQKARQQDEYRKAKDKWPHLSEYGEQFVLGTTVERQPQTEYV